MEKGSRYNGIMTHTFDNLRINSDRMLAAFNELAQIGATGDGGVNRPALSEAHLAARSWFRDQTISSGLEFRTDGAGNHSAILACGPKDSPTLLLGSHLDSVPNGGRFDGALGVMAAFEVLRTVKDAGLKLRFNLEAIDFTDEEGTLVGMLGSRALAGRLDPDLLRSLHTGRQAPLESLQRAGLSDESFLAAARKKDSLTGYFELHIEQGKWLERAGVDIGIVTAIIGISSYRLIFTGRADHSGTTTMDDRRDASLGASAFTLASRELVMKEYPDCVMNVGRIEIAPGAFNIVPARAEVWLEFRAPNDKEFALLDSALNECARKEARRFGLGLEAKFLGEHSPTPMSGISRQVIEEACDSLGLTHMPLVSGAGHDGQSLAGLCPVGMIFVPSVEGASHAPREFTKWADCVNGANVLLQAVLRCS
jgi:beta-ureidopropionase / N-carbamoyl-L-amino-acid hydrolase